MLVFGRALPVVGQSFLGKWAATEDTGATDIAATGFPASRALDGYWTRPTKPAAGATDSFLLFLTAGATVDACVVLGHNFQDAGASVTVELATADDATFSTNRAAIASLTKTWSDDRRAVLLAGGSRYTNVDRLSLKITTGAAFVPEVSEVFVGQRIQVATQPLPPYDDRALAADVRKHRGSSGIVTLVKRATGQLVTRVKLLLDGEDERTSLRSYFSGSDYGSQPFVFVPKPQSEPQRAYVLEPIDNFAVPNTRPPYTFEHTFEAREMGPYWETDRAAVGGWSSGDWGEQVWGD